MGKISSYPSMGALTGTELILGDQAGATSTMTPEQLAALIGVGKYAINIGDAVNVAYVVNHALGSRDVQVTVYRNGTPYDEVIVDITHTDANNVTVTFSTAPAANQFRVVVWA